LPSDEGIAVSNAEDEIAAVVRAYILDEFLLGSGRVEDDASLLESRVLDSTGIVALALYIEVAFEIELEDDDMTTANFDSVRRIAAFVARKRAAMSAPDQAAE
jgi:acyl carrier protein